jgi:indole-3-glycerol phosphate synthase
LQDLKHVSKAYPGTPTMRKDLLVDPYQVSEAFINGARGSLLIVAMLSDDMLNQMVERAVRHQMFVLLEAFDEKDMQRMQIILSRFNANRKNILLGVNCRDLRTLDVSFSRFEELSSLIPKDHICIAESGITKASEIKTVSKLGYKGALIGTALMKSEYPQRLLSEMRLAT